MPDNVAVGVLCIVVSGIAAQWLAWRTQLPAIVLLFAIGPLVGPGLQILRPAQEFGSAMGPLVGLAVAIVVFEGGLALNFRELRVAGEGVIRITVLALPAGFLLAAIVAHVLIRMNWGTSLLFGAITVVTGPTVVLPLLRHTRLEQRAASFLKWEAIVNDPVGALLAAIVLSVLLAGHTSSRGMLEARVLGGLSLAIGLGIGAGYLVRWMFNNDQAPEILKTPILLALALGIYAVSNMVMDEAGLAAATIFGVTLANLRIPGLSELARFKEALVVLLVSALFIVLTASLERNVLAQLSWRVFVLALAMLVFVRPSAILLATMRSNLTWRERVLVAWIAPRGIVAAAIAGIASAQLQGVGYPGAEFILPAVFTLIAATMVLHGLSIAPLARKLRLTLGDKPVLAIVGASPWSVDLAGSLVQAGVSVLLIDTFPGALESARNNDLPVLQAEILSEHGEHSLANQRIDYVLAATPDDVYNSLVNTRLAPELGRSRVFQLAPSGSELDDWAGYSREWRGQVLGEGFLTFAVLRHRFQQGWRFSVSDNADFDGRNGPKNQDPLLLAVIRRNGSLLLSSRENTQVAASKDERLLIFSNKAL